jgi:hypothetical protein
MTNYTLAQPIIPTAALDQHKVYLRTSWNSPWTEIDYLYCDWATWSVAGIQLNRAQLTYRYGTGMRPGESSFSVVNRGNPSAFLRLFVKVEFGAGSNTWRWYGTIESIGDNQEGSSSSGVPTGELRFNCYGLEFLLQQHRIVTSQIEEGTQLNLVETSRGITFNNLGRGNRSLSLHGSTYVFGIDQGDPSAVTDNIPWSSIDIVNYLLEYQTPVGKNSGTVDWRLHASAVPFIPAYDSPVLAQNGRRTLDLLDNLITRERGITWWYEVDDSSGIVWLHATSFTDSPISLGTGFQIPANQNVDNITIESDAGSRDVLWTSQSVDQVDQIVMQGARRTSTFTINHSVDQTAMPGWTPLQEQAYEDGASNWPDYGAMSEFYKRRQQNADARSREEVAAVFSEIKLPYDWDKLAGGGDSDVSEKQPVIPIDGDPTQSAPLYSKEAYFARNLSLLKGRDYSGNQISQQLFLDHNQKPHEPLKPFALALPPAQRDLPPIATPPNEWRRWIYCDKIGQTADLPYVTDYIDREWSCRVRILPDSTSLLLEVSGSQYGQHMLAGHPGNPQFSGLLEDLWDGAPEYDWREWIMTVSLIEDRYCEYRWPADASIPSTSSIRRLVIDAGDAYRRDYVVPNTVVGLDDDGHLSRSTSGGYVRDDTAKLESIVKAAWEWYGTRRNTIKFMTVFRPEISGIGLGRYIDRFNTTGGNALDVNSVVTQMKIIHTEVDEGQQAENAILSIETGFAEIDPQAFLPTF